MLITLLKLIVVAYFLNLAWEVPHSMLYTTCHNMQTKKYVSLIQFMSFKDALWISTFYVITAAIFRSTDITQSTLQLSVFFILSLLFSFIDETASLRMKRWRYTSAMPVVLGVGLSPLLEVAVTGTLSLLIVFKLLC